MAKIKCEINKHNTLVKFEALQRGDVFVYRDRPYMKVDGYELGEIHYLVNAFNMWNGTRMNFADDDLVNYVKSAELKLTI